MYDKLTWHSTPAHWSVDGDTLIVKTDEKTDFWNRTFYGFTRSNGHFFYTEVNGDFSCEVTLLASFEVLYDQLGLTVRNDNANWLKTGLEYSDGQAQMSTVVTRDWSDWSVTPVSKTEVADGVRIRLTRHEHTLRVQKRLTDGNWELVRLAHLDLPKTCQVGLMCCSPERAGFRAVFQDFQILPPIDRELHKQSAF